jgi:hypothetical protein
MTKINILKCCFLFVLLGCANTYKLEKKSNLSFSESYYKYTPTGVKGGDSAYNIFVTADKNSSLDKKNIKILGVYFKEKYAKFKLQGLDAYQAYIKVKGNADKLEFDTNKALKVVEIKEEKIPFILQGNEAVIRYSVYGKQKYLKIVLTKKNLKTFPM